MLYIAALKACSLINRLEFTLLMVSASTWCSNKHSTEHFGWTFNQKACLAYIAWDPVWSTFTDVLLKLISLQLTGEIWLQIM